MNSMKTIAIFISICGMCWAVPKAYNNQDQTEDNNNNYPYVPKTQVVNTAFGPQIITEQLGPDGSYSFHSNGPGFQNTQFATGGHSDKNNQMHWSTINAVNGNNQQFSSQQSAMGGGFGGMGSYQGQAMGMGGGRGMGMLTGYGAMPWIQPMKPIKFAPMKFAPMKFPEFKWWPSIFGNDKDASMKFTPMKSPAFKWWPSIFGNDKYDDNDDDNDRR